MWFTKWLERKLARPCAPHLLQSPDMGHCDDGEGRRESGRTEPAEWLGRDPHAQHSRAHNGMSAGMSVPCEPEPCRVDSHVTLPHATWRLPPRASPARRTASGLGPLVPHTERGCMTCTAPSRRRRHDHDPYRHGRHGRGARELAPRTGVRAARPRLGHASEAQRGDGDDPVAKLFARQKNKRHARRGLIDHGDGMGDIKAQRGRHSLAACYGPRRRASFKLRIGRRARRVPGEALL